jgi:hypothetical protein
MPNIAKLLLVLLTALHCAAQSKSDSQFGDLIREQAPVVAIEHVRVIDGTGGRPKSDQTILISGRKIAAIGNSAGSVFRKPPTILSLPETARSPASLACTVIFSM